MFTRRHALGILGAGIIAPRAYAQARHVYDLTPIQIADGMWMIEGSTDYFSMQNGGAIVNIVLIEGDSGLILIDSGPSLRYGEALASVARRLDLRGVSAVINTHHHPDHFFGNQVFADKPILSLGETLSAAVSDGDAFADNMYRLLGDWMRGTEVVPPTQVISSGEVTIDGRSFTALPLGGHTVADLAVLDRQTGTLIAGDLVFYDRAPTTPSADLEIWQASLNELEAINAAQLVPGHGPVDKTRAAIPQTRAYLSWLEHTLRNAAREGLDMIEVMDTTLPAEFAGMGAQPQEFHRSVSHLFPGIELQELPRGN
ncbi:quinoprotein relay system zinc metallohydrolase 1 [Marivita hallyeonensis]|uniref:Quinoprotein relay system zinc metallohydrolase 1 n=1 Tax=Marivita hallyeonensis TaxID=996342 RepID=A0A1M5WGX1_9RHOB|nr:quinoprotein relay system zinc metallohydrolase 1 [Marivita hallyeonensis]SHH86473.1 quinoprotein relay system zinc metallohydrolase 1 [Marivita hallyeonensis]